MIRHCNNEGIQWLDINNESNNEGIQWLDIVTMRVYND